MIDCVLLMLLMQATQSDRVLPAAEVHRTAETHRVQRLVKEVAESGRVLALARRLDERIRITPGSPPLLAFRYLEGRQRGRFGGLDLVLDDAGH